jgi:hypothetical protein
LHSKKDIETYIEIEVAEINVSARLKILVNEGEGWSGAHIWGPIAALGRPGEPVDTFEIQRDEVGHLSKCKLGTRTKENPGSKDRSHLGMHAEHEELRIKGSSGPHPEPPASGFAPNVILHVSNRLWNWRSICTGRVRLILRRGFQDSNSGREPAPCVRARP